jgi:signal transduction histidine kinase
MRSLESRLTGALLLSLIAVFGLQWLAVRTVVPRLLESSIAHELSEDADELLTAMNLDGRKDGPAGQPDAAFVAQHFDHYYEVFVGRDRIYASHSLAGASLGMPTLADGASINSRTVGPGGTDLLVHAKGYESRGQTVSIAVGADLAQHNLRVAGFLRSYGVVSALILLLLMLVQRWAVRRTLRVLARVSADLANVREGRTAALTERVPAEVLPLVREINLMSQAMAQRLQRSREALGNFAHAFKTPLTVLAQVARDDRLNDRPDVAHALAQQVNLLRGRINCELSSARLAEADHRARPVNLCDELRDLARTIEMIYRDKQLDIVCTTPLHPDFRGDRENMLELFGNLLDNACKYGRRRIQVTMTEDRVNAGLRLEFEDDGPGCPPEHYDQLTLRGTRFSAHAQGHGLGLAIAAEIVERIGGSLTFARSECLGGLRASLWLPFAHDDV